MFAGVFFTLIFVQHLQGRGHQHGVVVVGHHPVDFAAPIQALGHEDFMGMPGGITVIPGRRQ